ncbi:uroporphyrinogen-III synthase [Citricoccus sp. NR2]|uniref:uroporphyrinogen-III synthase n=1 Tax=Citricoccus sp. NR2 TaxID=3004095 RepID=UPI0022DCF9F4|nr:uroporphyrinogen-III synthase [Citricoccus sp. NR2]WBL17942.1 uroporphyrinogen-III synthase [Citricoccus sp. NR2]
MSQVARLVVTRQPAQASELESGLRAAGVGVEFLPVTDFALPEDRSALYESVDRLGSGIYQWLLITSPNAARALVHAGWDGLLPSTTALAVTGPGTARTVAALGCHSTPWMPREASARGLREGFPQRTHGGSAGFGSGRLLLPQSDLADPALAEALGARGWRVDMVSAYQTVEYPADPARRLLPRAGEILDIDSWNEPGAVVLLTSASAAREFHRRHPGALPHLIAIGEPTARQCRELDMPLLGTAPTPDVAGILAVLKSAS